MFFVIFSVISFLVCFIIIIIFTVWFTNVGLTGKKITKYYLFIDELLMFFIVIVPEKYI